ncbi:hypothetical protein L1987_42267 [Smallanthus sonchifolius]|uniref:Uncharacterized protein n=1 Tax=Smallanthus sonchifolius TaxID=185202 RepID=A0ACB9GW18_9ASTR|nr:hypothetical protein L1987_42267 [Smallanthus sonchifolius]
MAEMTAGGETPPNNTIYINNLNEKIKLDVKEIAACGVLAIWKNPGDTCIQNPKAQGSSMRIQYAKTKSDILAKADGTFVPREKRKKHDDKGIQSFYMPVNFLPSCYNIYFFHAMGRKRKSHHDANQAAVGVNPVYAGAYGATPPLSQIPYVGGAKSEAPASPNSILFIQKLPHETSSMMLQMLFGQHQGFKEVRMVEAKPGIAFIEYGDEMQATVAMHSLQGFKINPESPMLITYAKK